MVKREKTLPPGPNPRGDLLTEKDDRQLRETMRQKQGQNPDSEEKEWQAADLSEGERNGEHARKVAHTPGQAEGDRRMTDRPLENSEKERRNP